MRHDLIDLIGDRQAVLQLLLDDRFANQLLNVFIALICDDGLTCIIHLLFTVSDMAFNVFSDILRQIQLCQNLLIALEHLDGIPAEIMLRNIDFDAFLDMGDCMFHTARKNMGQFNIGVLLCKIDAGFRRIHRRFTLESAHLDNRAAKAFTQLLEINFVPVLLDEVHHVYGNQHRKTDFQQLCRQIEVALNVRTVNDVQNDIRLLFYQIGTGNDFLERIRRKGVNTRQIFDNDILVVQKVSFLLFNRDARPVADVLVGSRQVVEQRRFATVRIACQSNFQLTHAASPFTGSTSTISASDLRIVSS